MNVFFAQEGWIASTLVFTLNLDFHKAFVLHGKLSDDYCTNGVNVLTIFNTQLYHISPPLRITSRYRLL